MRPIAFNWAIHSSTRNAAKAERRRAAGKPTNREKRRRMAAEAAAQRARDVRCSPEVAAERLGRELEKLAARVPR